MKTFEQGTEELLAALKPKALERGPRTVRRPVSTKPEAEILLRREKNRLKRAQRLLTRRRRAHGRPRGR